MNFISISIILSLVYPALATKFKDCGSLETVSSVVIPGCPNSKDICILKKNTERKIVINFISTVNANILKSKVLAYNITDKKKSAVPFDMKNRDKNAYLTRVRFPVRIGDKVSYENYFRTPYMIDEKYLNVNGNMRVILRDEENKNLVCVEIQFKFQKYMYIIAL